MLHDAGVRAAERTDVSAIARNLARAFHDDPVMLHLLPADERRRADRFVRFMGIGVSSAFDHGSVLTTADHAATAVWKAPGHWRMGAGEMIRSLPSTLRALRGRAPMAKRTLEAIEGAHPSEPHWYLEILGTVPEEQGKGLGAAAMAPVLARCDAEGVPAYLESSKQANVPFYERHGFRVTSVVALPDDGPSIWLMWRDPQR